MCRLKFAAVAACVALSPLPAQQLPGRDLFLFPLGMLAEPGALASAAGGGFWNPATLALGDGESVLVSLAALNSPIEQGVSGQLATVGLRLRSHTIVGVSVAQSSVGDLIRTDTDPLSLGEAVPYRSTVVSAVAKSTRGATTLGFALRQRRSTVDRTSATSAALDIGGVLERPNGLPFRAALSTFLKSPFRRHNRETVLAAVEGYLPESLARSRLGASFQRDQGSGNEAFAYATTTSGPIDLRGGVVRQSAFGASSTRLRLGLSARHGHYLVGVAREDGTSGLGATYQFLLTAGFP